ncbi:MAG: hypothetical protein A3H88_01940 [Candidatus Blackburnbacteria bacterium RIFCSPLOWO2_02_FULL_44_9]|uniref:DegT/DnrJ/EryC1/StrS aminotransferase n=2 Tax=Patescibacteria group TaxID=1783273 RepID=A0A0G1KEL7_9BACT|nr:MAG: DegT/DnrJ/EryC1/StrS aminotransferase [Candidatus Azambacteria bacterium GW2011_GWA1_44_9]OGY10360.1 MAG: hypothetical protein A3D26_03555 [Candidatus Blackburnbacteria bacterium RIFCSPHIGHO2_02_FULL_44_20]OGY12129.1 MAG: hypothetical protein A3E16_00225 [Candidatus Blackburnbacteria bacterium RIFCSPHIGHO2_12_FULL_44_25]OGY16100.1 MAG: hypothetical protein A3H88_01940 [Candidatus Blackburnbacteria bacterium RIFCSPLOWO2_02_FULL_44_9]
MRRPIAISLAPNYERDDVLLAVKTLINPFKWFNNAEVEKLEKEFAGLYGNHYHALAVNSGRGAEYLILKALGIKERDEVIVQAFTCVAVPNSVRWLRATPVYVDIDNNYNIDPQDLEKKITKRTKAIIVQHTFGISANLERIKEVIRGKDIALVEDCAHSLGGSWQTKKIGTLGDVSFFSFGRDKVISSVFGGMILVNNSKETLFNRLKNETDNLFQPNLLWSLQQLLHPIAFSVILPVYSSGLGKLLLLGLQKLNLLSRAVYASEKQGKHPKVFPQKLPPMLAILAKNQFKKLNRFNTHRKRIADYYFRSLRNKKNIELPPLGNQVWLRFPIRVKNAQGLMHFAKKRGVLVGDWYKEIIAPCPDPTVVGYERGSCPNAEHASRHIVNLPTYPTLALKDAEKVVHTIKEWLITQ